MASSFRLLAVELVEEIVTYLDVHDIAALRLTCREIERKASYGSFAEYFKVANIDLTRKALQNFVHLTRNGGLGTHLQRCTISSIARNDDIPHHERTEYAQLLFQAFLNLKMYSPKKMLKSLTLRVSPISGIGSVAGIENNSNPFMSSRKIWIAAIDVFNIMMAALVGSRIVVEDELCLFGRVKGCSLTTDTLFTSWQSPVSVSAFRTIKKLNLSLSAPFEAKVEHSFEAETPSQMQARYCRVALNGILERLRLFPQLHSLELHWYRQDRILETSYTGIIRERQVIPKRKDLPQLVACILRGFYASGTTLLNFLSLLNPTKVGLENISLTSGRWDPIFLHIIDKAKAVHLDDLYQAGTLLHYSQVPGHAKWPSSGPDIGPTTLTYKNEVGPIIYRLASGTPRGSWPYHQWRIRRGKEYGPPWHDKYQYDEYNAEHVFPIG